MDTNAILDTGAGPVVIKRGPIDLSWKVKINDVKQNKLRSAASSHLLSDREHLASYADWAASERIKFFNRRELSCLNTIGYGVYRCKREANHSREANDISHQL